MIMHTVVTPYYTGTTPHYHSLTVARSAEEREAPEYAAGLRLY